jgi:hypothetical protein
MGAAVAPAPSFEPAVEPQGEHECALENVTRLAAGSSLWLDCGVLNLAATPEDLAAARQCVENARDKQLSFRLIWARPGIDSRVRAAVLGFQAVRGYVLAYFHYDSVGTEPDGALSTWVVCGALRFETNCRSEERLCVTCDPEPLGASIQCRCVVSEDGRTSSILCA